MKKTLMRALIFVLSTVILFSFSAVSLSHEEAEARNIYDIESELTKYTDLLSRLKKELASIKSDISDVNSESGQTTNDIKKYQDEILGLELEIKANQAISDSYDMKRADIYTQIMMTQEDYEYRLSMYESLMRYIYENGNMNSFELLFSSKSLAEYLSKRDNFNSIMECANSIIKEIEHTLDDLDILKKELEDAQKQYDDYILELNASKLDKDAKIKKLEEIAESLGTNYDDLMANYSTTNKEIKEITKKVKELEEERAEYYNSNSEFIWPLASNVHYRFTSNYGRRMDPFGKPTTEFHRGVDFACNKNSHIVASKGGTVTRASRYGGYGNCVIIYHGNGVSSLYAHCDSFAKGIREGVTVKQGQHIANVGTTGRSTGNHLHFSIIVNGQYKNPDNYLPDGYYHKDYNKD